jgi:hypothetical protein
MDTNSTQEIATLEQQVSDAHKVIRKAQARIHQLNYKPKDPNVAKSLRKQQKEQKYKTNNGLSVHNLRLAGYEVKVTHIRLSDVQVPKYDHHGELVGHNIIPVAVNSYLHRVYDFNPRGGFTHIVITNPDNGAWILVRSICHEIDSYDYKLGVKTALDSIEEDKAKAMLVDRSVLANNNNALASIVTN